MLYQVVSCLPLLGYMGLSENVGLIFPMNEIAIFNRDNDQQNHWVQWGTQHFQTHPYMSIHYPILSHIIPYYPIFLSHIVSLYFLILSPHVPMVWPAPQRFNQLQGELPAATATGSHQSAEGDDVGLNAWLEKRHKTLSFRP